MERERGRGRHRARREGEELVERMKCRGEREERRGKEERTVGQHDGRVAETLQRVGLGSPGDRKEEAQAKRDEQARHLRGKWVIQRRLGGTRERRGEKRRRGEEREAWHEICGLEIQQWNKFEPQRERGSGRAEGGVEDRVEGRSGQVRPPRMPHKTIFAK